MVIGNAAWRAYGPKGEKLDAGTSSDNAEHDTAHKQNFVEAIRDGAKLNFDIADGHVTSSICHMANTAWRVGRKLRFDPRTGRYQGDPEADRHLTRDTASPGCCRKCEMERGGGREVKRWRTKLDAENSSGAARSRPSPALP